MKNAIRHASRIFATLLTGIAIVSSPVQAIELTTLHEISTSPSQATGSAGVRFKLITEADTEYREILSLQRTDYVLTGRSYKAFKYENASSTPSHLGLIGVYRLSLRSKANLADARSDIYVRVDEYCKVLNTATENFIWKDPAQPTSTEICAAGNPPPSAKPVFVASSGCNSRAPYLVIRYVHAPTSTTDYTNHRFVASGYDDDDVMPPLRATWTEEGGAFCLPDINVPNPTGNIAKGPIRDSSITNTVPEYIGYNLIGANGQPSTATNLAAGEAATARFRFRYPVISATVSPVAINGVSPELATTVKSFPGQLDVNQLSNADGLYHIDVPLRAAASGNSNFYINALGSLGQISAPILATIKGPAAPTIVYRCSASATPTTNLQAGATIGVTISGTGEANTTCQMPAGSKIRVSISGQGTLRDFASSVAIQLPITGIAPTLQVEIFDPNQNPVPVTNSSISLSIATTNPNPPVVGQPPTTATPTCSLTAQTPKPVSEGQSVRMDVTCLNVSSEKVWTWTVSPPEVIGTVSQVSGTLSGSTFTGAVSFSGKAADKVFAVAAITAPNPQPLQGLGAGYPNGTISIRPDVQTASNTCAPSTPLDGKTIQDGDELRSLSAILTVAPASGSSAAACSTANLGVSLKDASNTVIDSKAQAKAGEAAFDVAKITAPGVYTLTFTPPTDVALNPASKSFTVAGCDVALQGGAVSAAPNENVNAVVTCNSSKATQIDFTVAGATTSNAATPNVASVSGTPITTQTIALKAASTTGTLTVNATTKQSPSLYLKNLSVPVQTAPCTIAAPVNTTISLNAPGVNAEFAVNCINAKFISYSKNGGAPVELTFANTAIQVPFTAVGTYAVTFTARDSTSPIAITSGAALQIVVAAAQPLDASRDVPKDFVPSGCSVPSSDVVFLEDAFNVLFNGRNVGTAENGATVPRSGSFLWARPAARADIRVEPAKTLVVAFFPTQIQRFPISFLATNDASPASGDNSPKRSMISKCPGSFDPKDAYDPTNLFCRESSGATYPKAFFATADSPEACPIYKFGPTTPVYVNIRQINEATSSQFAVTFQ
jgi:hypothetical protein